MIYVVGNRGREGELTCSTSDILSCPFCYPFFRTPGPIVLGCNLLRLDYQCKIMRLEKRFRKIAAGDFENLKVSKPFKYVCILF